MPIYICVDEYSRESMTVDCIIYVIIGQKYQRIDTENTKAIALVVIIDLWE